jgi:hypothetical protein
MAVEIFEFEVKPTIGTWCAGSTSNLKPARSNQNPVILN